MPQVGQWYLLSFLALPTVLGMGVGVRVKWGSRGSCSLSQTTLAGYLAPANLLLACPLIRCALPAFKADTQGAAHCISLSSHPYGYNPFWRSGEELAFSPIATSRIASFLCCGLFHLQSQPWPVRSSSQHSLAFLFLL